MIFKNTKKLQHVPFMPIKQKIISPKKYSP